jgi:hypothetical protein
VLGQRGVRRGRLLSQQPGQPPLPSATRSAPLPKPLQALSTGRYVLVDVQCRTCATRLGWKYLHAERWGAGPPAVRGMPAMDESPGQLLVHATLLSDWQLLCP